MFIPDSCIDVLYDYKPLLGKPVLAELPPERRGAEVAVVGAGPAGLLAAHELLKMGVKPVVYEAGTRLGGRLCARRFESLNGSFKPIAELGAMRIPRSSHIFLHYAERLGLDFSAKFPDPGIVDTLLHYRNKTYSWKADAAAPDIFKDVELSWQLFIAQLLAPLHQAWQRGDVERVERIWQLYIDQFKDMSFYEALSARSSINTLEAMGLFGALGIGSGGFSSIYQVGFLEILRIVANSYLVDQLLIADGTTEFAERLYRLKAPTPSGPASLESAGAVRFESPVIGFDFNKASRRPVVKSKRADGSIARNEYAAVVFTGSMCAAHMLNITTPTESGVYLLERAVSDAVKNTSAIASSKTFICTKEKFWVSRKMPQVILTDDLPRGIYFLDYPQTEYGVVCLSYTWGTDALKLHAVEPRDRVTIFRRVVERIDPEIAKHLVPLNDEVINVDWVNTKYQNGAFKLCVPGNDAHQKNIYFQFQSVNSDFDMGFYLAGDSVSWSGGWAEGAMYTSLNAVHAVAKRLGAVIPAGSPLEQKRDRFRY